MLNPELLWALGELNEIPDLVSFVPQPVTDQSPVTGAVQPVTAALPGFESVTGSEPPGTGKSSVTGCGTTDPPSLSVIQLPAFPRPAYEVVSTLAGLERHLSVVLERPLVSIDIETAGAAKEIAVDPRRGRIRLVSLSVADYPTLVVDVGQVPLASLAPVFARAADGLCRCVAHNAAFEQAFFRQNGLEHAATAAWQDTMLAAQLLRAGTKEGFLNHAGLDEVVERELGHSLDKSFQSGPWDGELSSDQYAYAACDSACLLPLASRFRDQLRDAGLVRVFNIESRALPFIVWCDLNGVPFDVERWQTLAAEARSEAERLWAQLDAIAPPTGTLDGKGTNWRSARQVLAQLRDHGYLVEDTTDAKLAELGPDALLPATLRAYRKQQRLASSYADRIVNAVHPVTGRIHPRLLQLGASSSGRMSARQPNIQGLPRDPRYRGCVRPSDPDTVMLKADYSSIELRLAAQISGDRRLIAAFTAGKDVLSMTAQLLLGEGREVTAEARQMAKAIAYGSLYGAGPDTLRQSALRGYGVVLDAQEAVDLQQRFFAAFPGLKRWQYRVGGKGVSHPRTLAGRRRLEVWSYSRKLNTPVQGSGADGMKHALGLLWERRAQAPSSVRPALLVHDEITVECARDDADAASEWLCTGMRDGMAEFITDLPVEVSATVGQSWAGEPLEERSP